MRFSWTAIAIAGRGLGLHPFVHSFVRSRVLGRLYGMYDWNACVATTTLDARGVVCGLDWVWTGQALTAMRLMHKEKAVLPELTEQFEAAEAWLRPMRP